MTKQTLKNAVLSAGLLGLALSTSTGLAQSQGLRGVSRPQSGAASAAKLSESAVPQASASYAYTFISFPGGPATGGNAMNLGATASQQMVTGYYGPLSTSRGFLLEASTGDGVTTETFSPVDYPGGVFNEATGINDEGQILGAYTDSAGIIHGYELAGGKYTQLNVPFTGADGTLPYAINDAGNIVGDWYLSGAEFPFGFELSGGTYTSLQFPGSNETDAFAINDNNDIVGIYYLADSPLGFLLSGGTYTTIEVPGSVLTEAFAINDAGVVVGFYCTTSACGTSVGAKGSLGFLLSNGVYTTFSYPAKGVVSTQLLAISNTGVILGTFTDSANFSQLFLAVPK